MTGENEIRINHDTMLEALHFYFKHVVFVSDKVPRISAVRAIVKNTSTIQEVTQFILMTNSNPIKEEIEPVLRRQVTL